MSKLLLINPDTTRSMTNSMASAARTVLSGDSQLDAMTSEYGPASIEGYYDEVFAIPPMLEIIRDVGDRYDGIIIGCFDDTGIEAARCVTDAPVIGICQASCFSATIVANTFTIITTLRRSIPALQSRVDNYGFSKQCKKIRASEIPVPALESRDKKAMLELYTQCELAIDDDQSEAIVLGCAGMVELQEELQDIYGMPVIEGVTSAATLIDGLARLPQKTSRTGGYSVPREKPYSGIFSKYAP